MSQNKFVGSPDTVFVGERGISSGGVTEEIDTDLRIQMGISTGRSCCKAKSASSRTAKPLTAPTMYENGYIVISLE